MSSDARRRLTVVVDGAPHEVEVSDQPTWPTTVFVDGRPYQVTIEPPQTQMPAAPARTATLAPVIPLVAAPPPCAAAAGRGDVQVRAPMPGSIVNVFARPGDAVVVGQQLCTLEAMKMKNSIRATRNGVVASVEVTEGQTVAFGDVLLTFQ